MWVALNSTSGEFLFISLVFFFFLPFILVVCFRAVKCISHFIVHSIKNPFPFAVCVPVPIPNPVPVPGTAHVYFQKKKKKKICLHVWVGRASPEPGPGSGPRNGLNWNWHPKFDNWVEVASSSAAFSNMAITEEPTHSIHINPVYRYAIFISMNKPPPLNLPCCVFTCQNNPLLPPGQIVRHLRVWWNANSGSNLAYKSQSEAKSIRSSSGTAKKEFPASWQ